MTEKTSRPVYGPRRRAPESPGKKPARKPWSGMPLAAHIAARGSILMFGALGAIAVFLHIDRLPEGDKPWGEAVLDEGIGTFTYAHIAALRDDPTACFAALDGSDMEFTPVEAPNRNVRAECRVQSGVRINRSNVDYGASPPEVASCALAASIYVWEREVVSAAARDHLGAEVEEIIHYGTYSCRRVNNAQSGRWSEHAGANAIDIAGFRLSDGRRVMVTDWNSGDARSAFLRQVRDESCNLFRGVLGPDYNAAHHNHFHLDMGRWRICR
tara:strand:+ start:1498 stop:2307 length:810 start_codon:yes stop_codon:yes gene_type:complete